MTSPVPDALRTQLAEVLWSAPCDPPLSSTDVDQLQQLLAPLLARARVEGAAEALREAADDWIKPDSPNLAARNWLRRRAAALSASTTTEGDPT